jgi:hypothetical protein
MADAMELSEQVYIICDNEKDPSTELRAFLDAHPQVSVNMFRCRSGRHALHFASCGGYAACVRMLLDQGADVDARDACGMNSLMQTSRWGHLECMQILIEAKADVTPSGIDGLTAAHFVSFHGYTKCLQLLIDNNADVNARNDEGRTPAMDACAKGRLPCLQLLLDNKADLNVRGDNDQDALYHAIGIWDLETTVWEDSNHLAAFAVLCCNTDAKNVKIDYYDVIVSAETVADCIEEYEHIQAYIDEYHRILKLALSEHVPVDPRFGLGQMGIYQEPLERVLEYLGMSMNKDQVVNTSIDGAEGIKRALLPFQVLNAAMWHDKYTRDDHTVPEESKSK